MATQKEVNYWLNRAKQKKQQGLNPSTKKAEKMVLGYEKAVHGLRYIVIYREVDKFDAVDYTKPFYVDQEGYQIGVRRQRIYNELEQLLEMWEVLKKQGFVYEKHSANHQDLKRIFDYGIVS